MVAQTLPPRYNLSPIGHLSYDSVSLAGCRHYVDAQGGEWALVGTSMGMSIVDLSDPTRPMERFNVPGRPSNWRELRTWAGYAYVGSEADSSGITIVNLNQLPDTVTWKVWYGDGIYEGNLRRSHTIQTKDGYLYVFGGGNITDGCTIADLGDPWNPKIIGKYTDNYVHDGFIRGDTLWTSEIYKGWFGVVDISDRTQPVLLATNPTPGAFNHNSELSPDGKTLFTTDEKPNTPLGAFDVSDLENITLIDTYVPGRIPTAEVHNVRVKGNYLINPSYGGQLTIVDATRPDNLIETAWDSLGTSLVWDADPYLPSGLLFATAKSEGLFVYRPTYHQASWLEGVVRDDSTDLPISNATVSVTGTANNDQSDQQGIYKTGAVDLQSVHVLVKRDGYIPAFIPNVLLTQGEVTRLDVYMTSFENIDVKNFISVSPSPFTRFLQVKIGPESPFAKDGTLVRLMDTKGALVYEKNLIGSFTVFRDVNHLPAGIYFLSLWNGNTVSRMIKLAKQ